MGRLADINAIRNQAAGVQDRLGRTLQAGDLVTTDQGQQILVEIQDVRPQMDPTGPKGHMILGAAAYQFFVPSGKRIPNLLLVHRPEKKDEPAPDPDELAMGGIAAKAKPPAYPDPAPTAEESASSRADRIAASVRKFFGR